MFSLCINSRLSLNFLLETASLGISATVTNLNVHNCLPFFSKTYVLLNFKGHYQKDRSLHKTFNFS